MLTASDTDKNLGFFASTAGQDTESRPASTPTTTEYTATSAAPRGRNTSGHTGQKRGVAALLRQRRSRIVPDLLDACKQAVSGTWTRPETVDSQSSATAMTVAEFIATRDEAEAIAKRLEADARFAVMCWKAWSKRGQIDDLRPIVADVDGTSTLPDNVPEAIELLQLAENLLVEIQHEKREAITDHITFLVSCQRSATSFELPDLTDRDPRDHALRPVWSGRTHWVSTVIDALENYRQASADRGLAYSASPATIAAVVNAIGDFFDPTGCGCTASNATIAARAIERHGATVSHATAVRVVRTVTVTLHNELGFMELVAAGRRLTALERLAARFHHGGNQTHAANRWNATLPTWARPRTDAAPTSPAPAYAAGLTERIETRDAARVAEDMHRTETGNQTASSDDSAPVDNSPSAATKYTYRVATVFPAQNDCSGVTHAGADAPENTDLSIEKRKTRTDTPHPAPISLRAWRIADDLSREGQDRGLDAGPYRHLVGNSRGQMALTTLARMIDQLTPATATTRDVLRGLVRAATSPTTGFVALGLSTRPRRAAAWMKTTLARIDWAAAEDFPCWSTAATAYGIHWYGPRRHWREAGTTR